MCICIFMYGIGGDLEEQLAKLGDGEESGRERDGLTVSGAFLGMTGLGVWVTLSIIIYPVGFITIFELFIFFIFHFSFFSIYFPKWLSRHFSFLQFFNNDCLS